MANEPVLTDAQLVEIASRALSQAEEDIAALPGDVVLLVGEVKRMRAALRSRDVHIEAIGQTSSQWKAEREKLIGRILELEEQVRTMTESLQSAAILD